MDMFTVFTDGRWTSLRHTYHAALVFNGTALNACSVRKQVVKCQIRSVGCVVNNAGAFRQQQLLLFIMYTGIPGPWMPHPDQECMWTHRFLTWFRSDYELHHNVSEQGYFYTDIFVYFTWFVSVSFIDINLYINCPTVETERITLSFLS